MNNNNTPLLIASFWCSVIAGCGGGTETTETKPPEKTSFTLDITCDHHVLWGAPTLSEEVIPVCHNDYLIAYDVNAKIPRFTSHEVTVNEALNYVDRENNFSADPLLPSTVVQATSSDYSYTGYDRGHMVPWGDTGILQDALDTNVYSNVAPMLAAFNRGVWLKLENEIRAHSRDFGADLYVITGAISDAGIDKTDTVIGDNVEVPKGFYKIIIDRDSDKVGAYFIEQSTESNELSTFSISIDELESQSGINFMPLLSPEQEARYETSAAGFFE
ncbi:DNA/RNA non-specific endonuclease [Thalassotalea litorea]|uniref:Endonuclease n=1 Tax=Thalassotalea litorea TaxID=2020715 RepID=A0A5R9IIW4_9GAMM|nr:DNA/RNA non-specific endonuclease [Thalassotalea litorea]TLU61217.1 DNA/RNA non-specific endonuclease [Thalassotalea litorea]